MNKLLPFFLFSILLLLPVGIQNAFAEIITIEFTGVVTSITDSNNLLDGDVIVGDTFNGIYSYDSEAMDRFPANPEAGIYSIEFLSVAVGSNTYGTTTPPHPNDKMRIGNDVEPLFPSDLYQIDVDQPVLLGGTLDPRIELDDVILAFADRQATVFDSIALPLLAPDLDEFEKNEFKVDLEVIPDDSMQIFGTITELRLIQNQVGGELVPLDITALLLAGAYSTSWIIPIILSGIGIGLVFLRRK